MYEGEPGGYTANSAEYIQMLAREASIVFAVFTGFYAWFMANPSWQWIVPLTVASALFNLMLVIRHTLPGVQDLIGNLVICAGLTGLGAEYSNLLYHLLLLRVALRVGKHRAGRIAVVIGGTYSLAWWSSNGNSFSAVAGFAVLYNLIGLAVIAYGTVQMDKLITKRINDDRQMLELIKQNDRNYRMALTDGLTGLYNHRAYKEKIDGLAQYVLLIIDIDHFKKLNDTHGHLIGDKVLVTISNIIKVSIRTGDMAFRYGGEEFVVILPGTTIQMGYKIAERLREKVADCSFEQGLGKIPVTISIGLTVKKHGMVSQAVFEQADSALYRAKQSGRNNVQIYEDATEKINLKFSG
jgi:diguanylate cyclase (GGDEF)-like protein